MTPAEKKANGAAALDWALAAYLLTAGPNTYFSYAWWYQMDTGYIPCDLFTGREIDCSCPDDWYPDLLRPTGAPLGPRMRVSGGSGHVWARRFERVDVRVDLGNFSDVSLVWK